MIPDSPTTLQGFLGCGSTICAYDHHRTGRDGGARSRNGVNQQSSFAEDAGALVPREIGCQEESSGRTRRLVGASSRSAGFRYRSVGLR
jgi:hypothetical protein